MAIDNKWVWEAGRMYLRNPRGLLCRHRVAILAGEMKLAGEKFQIIKGRSEWSTGKGHVWIEQNGKVLDPTQSGNPRDKYKLTSIIYVDQGSFTQDREADEFIAKFKNCKN